MTASTPFRIPDAQRRQYREEGYFILGKTIPDDHLALLRNEYEALTAALHQEMDRRGVDAIGVNQRNRQYLLAGCHNKRPALEQFLFSEVMAEVCQATLGDEAYFLWDQFIVKGPGMELPFKWHQDGGCIDHDHRTYMVCWCAMDDVSVESGAVNVLPFSKAGVRERAPHRRDPETNELIGYFGSEPGVPIVGPAGCMGVYTSVNFHRSGPNMTDRMRRAYLIQYSAEPMMNRDGTGLFGYAVPFLKGGERVR